jgi:Flp pilus assembly protein TadG
MRRLLTRPPNLRDQRGGVLVVTAIVLPLILLVAAYVINVAIWYVHRQHLQTEADAAALAGGNAFQLPCTSTVNTNIGAKVHQYDGTSTYNQQVWATPIAGSPDPQLSTYSNTAHNLFSVINRPDFFNQSIPNDTGLSGTTNSDGSPCSDTAVDVKLSETNLPSVFPFGNPAYINAQARVSIKQLQSSGGGEPFVEPLPQSLPSSVTAQLVDESTGNSVVAGPVTLSDSSSIDPATFTGALPNVTFPSVSAGNTGAADAIGLELCYSGNCYESGGTPGVSYIRDWADSSSTSAPPQVGDIIVTPGGSAPCSSPNNFVSTSSACTIVVQAKNVTFPTVSTPTCGNNGNVSLSLVVGTASPVTFPCPSGSLTNATWTSSPVTVNESTGLTNLALHWQTTTGSIPTGASGGSGGTCGNGTGRNPPPCTGTVDDPHAVTQRINSGAFTSTDASTSQSGSIIAAGLTDASNNPIMSVHGGTTENVGVSVTLLSFEASSTFGGPAVELSFGGNQQNAAIGCNGNSVGTPQFFQSMVSGCSDVYQRQPPPGTCPPPAQYSNPPSCAQENPGQGKLADNLAAAMNCRINGSGQATNGGNCVGGDPRTCVNPNHWTAGPAGTQTVSDIENTEPNDPRLLLLMVTNNSALINGAAQIPVIAFTDFYVTGWSSGGQPTSTDPCLTQSDGQSSNGLYYTKDDPRAATAPPGVLFGHFVDYNHPPGPGVTGSGVCASTTLSDCTPVLTK